MDFSLTPTVSETLIIREGILHILPSSGENLVLQAPSGNYIDLKTEGGSTVQIRGSAITASGDISASGDLSYNSSTGDFRLPQPLDSAANPTFNQLRGPASFVIDPATIGDNTGTVRILGNLQVEGTQTTINSATLSINDKNIVIADSAADSSALDGGGITWGGDSVLNNPSLTYSHADKRFRLNRALDVQPNEEGNTNGTHWLRGKAPNGVRLYLDNQKLLADLSGGGYVGKLGFVGLDTDSNQTYYINNFDVDVSSITVKVVTSNTCLLYTSPSPRDS